MMARTERVAITSSGIQNSLSRFEPLKSLCEYIWNGFDAQASVVKVDMVPNELGVATSIAVSDNGTGIDRQALSTKFRPIFESEKMAKYNPEIKHSHTKGKNGVGRLTFFKFAERAVWNTVYARDNTHYSYSIEMNRNSLNTKLINAGFM